MPKKLIITPEEAQAIFEIFDSAPIQNGSEYRRIREPLLRKISGIISGDYIVVQAPRPKQKKESAQEEEHGSNSE